MLGLQGSVALVALGAATAALAGDAAAQQPARPPAAGPAATQPADARVTAPAKRVPSRRGPWYGWQTLTVDAAALLGASAVAATADVEPDRLNVLAATWYGLSTVAAPAVHYAHDNWPIGASVFGIRALAPPAAGLFGLITACTAHGDFEGDCARPGWAVGSLVGISGAALLDALLLGYEHPPEAPPPATSWYGWQTLAIDIAGFAAGAIAVARGRRTNDGDDIHPALGTWAIGLTVGVIGGPIVHFAHGRVGIGLLSLASRLLVGPLIGVLPGLLGYCAATAGASDCVEHGALWGVLGGAVAVSLFDALVLGYELADDGDQTSYAPSATIGPGTIGIRGYW